MGEVTLIVLFVIFVTTIFLSYSIRVDWKDLSKEKNKLYDAWSDYYAEKRKYRELDSVIVKYKSGFKSEINGVRKYSIEEEKHLVIFYDEHEVAIKIINYDEVSDITFIRSNKYIEGERNIFDD